ncbi:hypothetical protein EZV62_008419 [Acer yangbiense]|uniref:Uncharacterized protein n=1 Tax=Acer yangbiense TaxID=1000413 RepID=A0A5C7IDK9_9ROSI|nr:hypothetical protein EZV62_008419 [Acer yangbiense]
MFFDQDQIGVPLEGYLSLTVAQKQKLTIREISPEWGYTTEATKVIIGGSFLCDPSESSWLSPPCPLCITSGNRGSCSEVKEFDYQILTSSCIHDNSSQTETTKSRDELLLLVRFVQLLLSDPLVQKGDDIESRHHLLRGLKAEDELWGQELLKDTLQQWLSSKSMGAGDQPGCSLSKKERGIIHMIAGLGFEWALNPILSHGVGVNFRDINGWTALHWASRFGREKMAVALLASGALTGRTPAFIAASNGHKGLAVSFPKALAEVEAEIAVLSVTNGSLSTNEDQLSLKDTLAAVRNAAQAAARIQSAFRAHSFRRRQQKDAAGSDSSIDQYGIDSDDIPGLLAMSKVTFRNVCDYNSAALSIQKKYRGWKGREDYLAFRKKVVKIQIRLYCGGDGKELVCEVFSRRQSSIDDSKDEDILKAELGATAAAASISGGDIVDMDNDDSYLLE